MTGSIVDSTAYIKYKLAGRTPVPAGLCTMAQARAFVTSLAQRQSGFHKLIAKDKRSKIKCTASLEIKISRIGAKPLAAI
jgi:hypothetical protein